MTTARESAVRCAIERALRFPNVQPLTPDVEGLSPRDAALAKAIDHAVATRWLTLRYLVCSVLQRPWTSVEPEVKALLLTGTAQLYFLDRLPEHAVVDEAVNLAKHLKRAKSAGLINAVLRRLAGARLDVVDQHDPERRDEIALSDGRAWRVRESVLHEDPLVRLVQQTSCCDELVGRWRDRFGWERTMQLAYQSLVRAPLILHGLPDDVAAQHEHITAHEAPGYHVFDGTHDKLLELLQAPRADLPGVGVGVQDPSSAEPVKATASCTPKLIVDACAGRGTKTRQLAELHPEARIIATDIDATRRAVLEQVFADHERVEVVRFNALIKHAGQADLLVLDVPCSNTGVLARRPEARYRFTQQSLSQLVDVQRQVMADTLALLAEDGVLLYATCSVEPEENEQQMEWLGEWHHFRVLTEGRTLPPGFPGQPPTAHRDGGYWALLSRSAAAAAGT